MHSRKKTGVMMGRLFSVAVFVCCLGFFHHCNGDLTNDVDFLDQGFHPSKPSSTVAPSTAPPTEETKPTPAVLVPESTTTIASSGSSTFAATSPSSSSTALPSSSTFVPTASSSTAVPTASSSTPLPSSSASTASFAPSSTFAATSPSSSSTALPSSSTAVPPPSKCPLDEYIDNMDDYKCRCETLLPEGGHPRPEVMCYCKPKEDTMVHECAEASTTQAPIVSSTMVPTTTTAQPAGNDTSTVQPTTVALNSSSTMASSSTRTSTTTAPITADTTTASTPRLNDGTDIPITTTTPKPTKRPCKAAAQAAANAAASAQSSGATAEAVAHAAATAAANAKCEDEEEQVTTTKVPMTSSSTLSSSTFGSSSSSSTSGPEPSLATLIPEGSSPEPTIPTLPTEELTLPPRDPRPISSTTELGPEPSTTTLIVPSEEPTLPPRDPRPTSSESPSTPAPTKQPEGEEELPECEEEDEPGTAGSSSTANASANAEANAEGCGGQSNAEANAAASAQSNASGRPSGGKKCKPKRRPGASSSANASASATATANAAGCKPNKPATGTTTKVPSTTDFPLTTGQEDGSASTSAPLTTGQATAEPSFSTSTLVPTTVELKPNDTTMLPAMTTVQPSMNESTALPSITTPSVTPSVIPGDNMTTTVASSSVIPANATMAPEQPSSSGRPSVAVTEDPSCPIGCPPGWSRFGFSDHCYHLPAQPAVLDTFWNHQQRCKELDPSAYIFVVNGLGEQAIGTPIAMQYAVNWFAVLTNGFLWLGGYRDQTSWHFVDGTDQSGSILMAAANLIGSQSNDTCLGADAKTLGLWQTRPCSDKTGTAICEMPRKHICDGKFGSILPISPVHLSPGSLFNLFPKLPSIPFIGQILGQSALDDAITGVGSTLSGLFGGGESSATTNEGQPKPTESPCPVGCPEGWVSWTNFTGEQCYKLPPPSGALETDTFWNMQDRCKRTEPSSYISMINGFMELSMASAVLNRYSPDWLNFTSSSDVPAPQLWIGAYMTAKGWQFLDGTDKSGSMLMTLADVQQGPYRNGKCLAADLRTGGQWTVVPCSARNGAAFCEMSKKPICEGKMGTILNVQPIDLDAKKVKDLFPRMPNIPHLESILTGAGSDNLFNPFDAEKKNESSDKYGDNLSRVYCAKPYDGYFATANSRPTWTWLYDENDQQLNVPGRWISLQCQSGRPLDAFQIQPSTYLSVWSRCKNRGYDVVMPADSVWSGWFPFKIDDTLAEYYQEDKGLFGKFTASYALMEQTKENEC